MTRFQVIAFVLLSALSSLLLTKGWTQAIEFEHLGLEEGLSQISVMSISQDKYGSIWLGTRNGLNRYDGKKVTIYRTSDSRPSLIENQIQTLLSEDSLIWVHTPNSISAFNLHTETFRNYPLTGISSFYLINNNLWVATADRLFLLDPLSGTFHQTPVELRKNERISKLMEYNGHLLIGTNMGVWKKDDTEQTLLTQEQYQVMCLYVDRHLNIWIGTNQNGLLKQKDSTLLKHYHGNNDLSNDYVRCVEEDDEGNIWVGTFTGLDVIKTDGSISHYENYKGLRTSLSHNSIWSLYKDRDGAMWAGTYYGGANVFHPTRHFFSYYPENTQNNRGVNFRVVGQVLEDAKKNLWICTDGGGLNYFERSTGKFSYFTSSDHTNSISANNVKSLCLQGDSVLWIGTHRAGLDRLNLHTNTFTHYVPETTSLDSSLVSQIQTILPYEDNLLIGTGAGLLLFDLKTYQFSPFLPAHLQKELSSPILSILHPKAHEIWIGTEKSGVFRYNTMTQKLLNYRSDQIPSNCVYQLYKDQSSRIWIATSDGLTEYLPEEDNFRTYSMEDGLPGNIAFGIVESPYSGLVVETDKGISFFNPTEGSFQNISSNNGLPLRELSPNGIYHSSDGILYISGVEGLVALKELDFLSRKSNNYPMITGLSINNHQITPELNPDIISRTIMDADIIRLKHQHSSISFSISDMAFTKSSRQGLEYMLEGFDKKWIKAEARNNITYTNLDNGTYNFFVRTTNSPDNVRKLSIVMSPPFYLSSWAFVTYFVIVIGIIILINLQYIRQSKLAYNLEVEKENHRKDEQLNQQKIQFFTNISHEFRTPLTLIIGQIELILENSNLSPGVYNRLLNVQKHTLRLRNLISELLDFRKMDQNKIKLRVQEHDFIPFMKEIYLSFFELAEHGNIDYTLKTDFESFPLWFDRNQMEKVFYNLIANAFKFTPESGQIIINSYEIQGDLFIEIINTGSFIPSEKVNKIFDRFYQLDNMSNADEKQGTGIGLALAKGVIEAHHSQITVNSSSKDQSTTFKVQLKGGSEHYHKSNLEPTTYEHKIALVPERETPTTYTEMGETVLIVEDNLEVMEFLKDLLRPLFKIQTAYNGLEALEFIKQTPPDLVISDVLMPKMSGTELCTKIKTDLLTSHIPVVLLTAKTSDEHRIEGLETGADDYITKPFNTKILIARINNVLNNRKSLQNLYKENPIQHVRKVAKKRIDKEFMEKAQEVVLKNISNSDYNVESFSRDMSLGRTNLFTKIKGITGQTPNEFITNIRLNKAAQMIAHQPDKSISDIGYACGFSNPNYFSRAFKKNYNLSPTAYKNQLSKEAALPKE
ncbi:hybrid sensor histidine kinase/response regulator transcription factor [Marinoscillum furvescens]|uniref:histidine kinase n=1 Tax=Marinoscillum furvescens DSM 4134 TaxID=1122208 RepID=A0A3D9L6P4_MARFU|nr:two-component regulator propeller domain-containing protein [Marinoscillum furvescens]REE01144.1 two component regulator with propeller domain [Marinoscillum furvescens DSM 4134]